MGKIKRYQSMYADRKLSEGYPELESLSTEWFTSHIKERPDDLPRVRKLLNYLSRLTDITAPKKILIVGCGPRPEIAKILKEMGYQIIGVDPIQSYVRSAQEYLGDEENFRIGCAESLPIDDCSQDIVMLESVLEHVDSPFKSLFEAHRVLCPGGITLVSTTNKYKFSPVGENGEFNVCFYN